MGKSSTDDFSVSPGCDAEFLGGKDTDGMGY